jgi:hypothetical protein
MGSRLEVFGYQDSATDDVGVRATLVVYTP